MQIARYSSEPFDQPLYSGAAKAALVLLAMQRASALDLLKSLDPADLRIIMKKAAELKRVEGAELDAIVSEFENSFNEGVKFVGTVDEVRQLVTEALGDDGAAAALTEKDPAVVAPPPWAEINVLSDDVLKPYLLSQHPQTAAVILARMEQARSAELLHSLPPDQSFELLARLLNVRELDPQVELEIEAGVRADLLAGSTGGGDAAHQRVAGMINDFDAERSNEALDYISKHRPDDARVVRKYLFKFDDLVRLAPPALAVVVERLPVERIVIALRDAPVTLQEAVLAAMAPRARRMAESELRSDTPATAKAIAEARRFVAQAVLNLAASGAVELPRIEGSDGEGAAP